jgi:hypothetical protein
MNPAVERWGEILSEYPQDDIYALNILIYLHFYKNQSNGIVSMQASAHISILGINSVQYK